MATSKDFNIDLKMRADFAQAQAELRNADRNLRQIEGTLGRANLAALTTGGVLRGTAVAATAMGVAAAAVMSKYVANTIEAEKVQAQLSSRIKDTAGVAGRTLEQLNAQAEKLQNLTVFDDEAIGQAQAMLLTFTQLRGVNFDRTIDGALDLATVMRTDAADAAKALGKALSDPERGLGQLRKAGIDFTDAEEARIKKMMEAGQVAEAQAVILGKLESKMGSAAEAARNTLGGAISALKNAFDNLLEGDSGDAGVVGTREAIESLIITLNDPQTKAGFDSIISGAVTAAATLARFASTAAATTRFLADAVASRIHGAALDDIVRVEQAVARQQRLVDQLDQAGTPAARRNTSGYATEQRAELKRLQDMLALSRKMAAEGVRRRAPVDPPATREPALPDPKPEGQGEAKPSTAKSSGKKADPDADIKRRIESLKEERALLDAVTEGEEKASEAAKVRYEISEGEFKNNSPALKQQLLAQAEALDQARVSIRLKEEEKKKFKEAEEAFKDLREELRTPAEAALDQAIEQVNTLNSAIQANIKGAAEFREEALSKVARGLTADQPAFQGLAPEVGGAVGELAKLEQAAAANDTWRQNELAKNAAFRAQDAANKAAADAEEERIEAAHQARMQAISDSRQQATLNIASDFFGQLAQLQRSENSKMAAVGKAAAVAQAIINTYQAATAAYKALAGVYLVGPVLGAAAAAAAIAAGMANVAAIRSQPTGYAEGGYTGHGGKYEPAGIVHKGEVVINRDVVRQPGMLQFLEAINDNRAAELYGWAGYEAGGVVAARPSLPEPKWDSFPQGALTVPAPKVNQRNYLVLDKEDVARVATESSQFETRVMQVYTQNPGFFRGAF